MSKRDPYQVLGISRSAPVKEIRRAYRRLARKLHPDASGRPETADAFHKATVAYQELCQGTSDKAAIPIPVTVVPRTQQRDAEEPRGPRPGRDRVRASPRVASVEPLSSRERDAEPLVKERWRRTEAALEIEPDLELLLGLLRAGYFPW